MEKRLEKIIREVFKLNEVNIDESWSSEDIPAWDSMGHLSLILAIEREFSVKFETEEMFQIRSLDDISRILKEKSK